jgi:hypothetical protein
MDNPVEDVHGRNELVNDRPVAVAMGTNRTKASAVQLPKEMCMDQIRQTEFRRNNLGGEILPTPQKEFWELIVHIAVKE